MDLRDYLRILRRKRAVVIISFLFVVLGYTSVIYRSSQIKIASARYILKQSNYTRKLIGSLVSSPTLSIAAQLELLHNPSTLEQIYRGLKQTQDYRLVLGNREKGRRFLSKSLNVAQVGESEIIQVTARAPTEKMAKELANFSVDVIVEQINNLLNREIENARAFLDEKIALHESNLSSLRKQKDTFLREHGLVDMGLDLELVTQRLSQINADIEKGRLAIQRQQLWQSTLQEKLKRTPQMLATDEILTNPEFTQYKQTLLNLQLQLAELKEKYTDKHPAVQTLKERIERVKEEMQAKVARFVTVKKNSPNPMQAALRERLIDTEMQTLDASLALSLNQKLYLKEKQNLKKLTATQSAYAELEHKIRSSESVLASLQDSLEKVRLSEMLGQKTAQVYQRARDARPLRAFEPISLLLMLFLGLAIATGTALVTEFIDDRVKSSHTCKKILHSPVFGIIPSFKARDDLEQDSLLKESFRKTAFELRRAAQQQEKKTLLITSLHSGNGKTTLATAIAQALARGGKNTLLVDGDLRKPALHRLFQIEKSPGLVDLISGKLESEAQIESLEKSEKERENEGRVFAQAIHSVNPTGLSVLTSGSTITSPSEFLSRLEAQLQIFLEWGKEQYDFVLIDSPPFLPVVDPSIYASLCDGLLLVVDTTSTYKKDLTSFLSLIRANKIQLIGAILNRLSREDEDYYYYYYYAPYAYSRRLKR